jgi:phenylpyruvate tautomerase PptA (4-oxalocrotonate tautomerase family)
VPIVRIDIQTGKSTAYKREILSSVRTALVTALGVPNERVTQRVIETEPENIDSPEENRSDRLTIIEVSMISGRDANLKQAMYQAIVAQLAERPGIHQHDITVIVNDPSAECFAIGGVMQCTLPGVADLESEEEESLAEQPPPEAVVRHAEELGGGEAADAAPAAEPAESYVEDEDLSASGVFEEAEQFAEAEETAAEAGDASAELEEPRTSIDASAVATDE